MEVFCSAWHPKEDSCTSIFCFFPASLHTPSLGIKCLLFLFFSCAFLPIVIDLSGFSRHLLVQVNTGPTMSLKVTEETVDISSPPGTLPAWPTLGQQECSFSPFVRYLPEHIARWFTTEDVMILTEAHNYLIMCCMERN